MKKSIPFEFAALRVIQRLEVFRAAEGMSWACFGLYFGIHLSGAPDATHVLRRNTMTDYRHDYQLGLALAQLPSEF
ncbi:hypothetical protein [Arthrobacter sp. 9V]|uniref:hypothetical protein n=1 Tax=Arthrobacter sp. 9V TaxID=2653132 RepID=UPI001356D133|nr:hypothetical protein [Arthrobacter sp. 9V]